MLIREIAEVTKKPRVFVDLDGVCADFFAGYQKLNPDVASEDEMPDGPDHTYDLMRGTDFFYTLPKYDSTDDLIATILEFAPCYRILSAPLHGDYANCKRNKMAWVADNLSPDPVRVIITSHKYRHAVDPHTGQPNVLIDDKAKNIRPWIETGGIGILYHAPSDSLDKVRDRLAEVFGQ